jgi:hypothetical protein
MGSNNLSENSIITLATAVKQLTYLDLGKLKYYKDNNPISDKAGETIANSLPELQQLCLSTSVKY